MTLSLSLCPSLSGRLSRLAPRTCCLPSSTRSPSGSSTVQCPGGSSSSSSHTTPRSTARSPFTVATGSKVSVHSAFGAGSGRALCASADPLLGCWRWRHCFPGSCRTHRAGRAEQGADWARGRSVSVRGAAPPVGNETPLQKVQGRGAELLSAWETPEGPGKTWHGDGA